MFVLNREDFPDMAPLNTRAGQMFVDKFIDAIGGVDCVLFDNLQSLLLGSMREEDQGPKSCLGYEIYQPRDRTDLVSPHGPWPLERLWRQDAGMAARHRDIDGRD